MTTILALVLILSGCGGTSESACVVSAKESRDFKRKLAKEKWEDAQYKISEISDRALRLMQRENSTDIRAAKEAQAEVEYEKALLKCESSTSKP